MLTLTSTPAAAAAPCTARLEAPDVASDDRWSGAVDELNGQLREQASDCALLRVQPTARGSALVLLTTVDGRSAARRISRPEELASAVRALLVSSPNGAEDEGPPAEETAPEETPEDQTSASPPERRAGSPVDANVSSDTLVGSKNTKISEVFLSVAAGLRLPAHDFASPMGKVRAGVVLGRWELSAFGRWEPTRHVADDDSAHHTSLSSFGGGASVGRRESLGVASLLIGGTAAIHIDRTSFHDGYSRAEGAHDELLAPRFGGYVGVLFPVSSRVRMRTELSGELALATKPVDVRLPESPPWGVGLTFGFEVGVAR
jgi:opacity protein-like surface antigen